MRTYDAILVPGGGVREGGELPSWVRRRLDRAIERQRGEYILTLSAGTTHRPPPIGAQGFPIFESVAGARYLIAAGVPPERILAETCSWDTVGNAFFSRIIHAEPRAWRRLLVITSGFHLERTRAAFQWVYGLEPRPFSWELEFEGVDDPAMDPALLARRGAKESASLAALEETARRITGLAACHRWLFTEHLAYRASAATFGGPRVDGETLESY